MKFYYYINKNDCMLNGYTTNPYTMKRYVNQFNSINENEIFDVLLNEIEFDDEETFLIKINKLLSYRYTKSFYMIDKTNKLYSIKDSNSDEIIVINNRLYEDFTTKFIQTGELNKFLYRLYIDFGNHGEDVRRYINGSDNRLIQRISDTIMNDYYGPLSTYKGLGPSILYSELCANENSSIWEYYNEYSAISNYITSKILSLLVFA